MQLGQRQQAPIVLKLSRAFQTRPEQPPGQTAGKFHSAPIDAADLPKEHCENVQTSTSSLNCDVASNANRFAQRLSVQSGKSSLPDDADRLRGAAQRRPSTGMCRRGKDWSSGRVGKLRACSTQTRGKFEANRPVATSIVRTCALKSSSATSLHKLFSLLAFDASVYEDRAFGWATEFPCVR